MTKSTNLVLAELVNVFESDDLAGHESVIREIVSANRIVCVGAGRVGLAVAAFAKRLRHLGKDAFWIEDVTLPRMSSGDLMLIGSGSGETETVACLGRIAKRLGLRIALITASQRSTIMDLADSAVTLNCPSKFQLDRTFSLQPMTSLFEQAAHIYMDSLVLDLMEAIGVTAQQMEERHNAIE